MMHHVVVIILNHQKKGDVFWSQHALRNKYVRAKKQGNTDKTPARSDRKESERAEKSSKGMKMCACAMRVVLSFCDSK
jgi:hypothetical protein